MSCPCTQQLQLTFLSTSGQNGLIAARNHYTEFLSAVAVLYRTKENEPRAGGVLLSGVNLG